jgi:hypothetical protein
MSRSIVQYHSPTSVLIRQRVFQMNEFYFFKSYTAEGKKYSTKEYPTIVSLKDIHYFKSAPCNPGMRYSLTLMMVYLILP